MQILRELLRRGLTFLVTANMEKYEKKYPKKRAEIEDVEWTERPVLQEYYEFASIGCCYGWYFFMMLIGGGIIITLIMIPMELRTQEDKDMIVAMFVALFWVFVAGIVLKYFQLYNRNKVTYYCKDRMVMRSYGRKDRVVSYDEIGECLKKKKKIRLGGGGMYFPLKKGKVFMPVHEELLNNYVLGLIGRRCKIKIPKLTDEEEKLIMKSGMLKRCLKIAFAVWLVDFGFTSMGATIERSQNTFFEVYFRDSFVYFLETHFFFTGLGIPVIVFGLIFWGLNYFPFKMHFRKHEMFKA